jgi:intraflagellar transport protein 140
LDPEKDEESLQRVSGYLAKHGSKEGALLIMLQAKKYDQVCFYNQILDLCETNGVSLTAELVEKIHEDSDVPKGIHLRLGEMCLQQSLYHQSCKSFALGGDRVKAMEALLRSGDRDKIITFANVSKNANIFTMAANFLQTLNWSNDTTMMRTIIQFYTKAKAHQSLSRFYETCAQIEIDEYQNYEKALAALVEAEKALEKDKYASLDALKYRQKLLALFLEAYSHAESNEIESCEAICAELLNQDDIDEVIRIGDIFGLLIETNFRCGDREKAAQLLQRLQMRLPRSTNVEYYVNEDICKALNPESYAQEEIEEEI